PTAGISLVKLSCLEETPNRFRRIPLLSNHRFQRTFLSDRRRVLSAQPVQTILGFAFPTPLGFQRLSSSCNLFCQSRHALRYRFKLQRQLPALPPEGFHLRVRSRH